MSSIDTPAILSCLQQKSCVTNNKSIQKFDFISPPFLSIVVISCTAFRICPELQTQDSSTFFN